MRWRIRLDSVRTCLHALFRTRDALTPLWRRFAADRTGAIALLFGLTMVPTVALLGGAVDYANAYRIRSELQSALDTATLAAGREADTGASADAARQVGLTVLAANLGEDFPPYEAGIDLAQDGKTVNGMASANVDTYVLGIVGQHNVPVRVESAVTLPDGKVEIAMVLDNSGSMAGSRLTALKNAAESLAEIVFAAPTEPDFVKVAVVPFAAAVNVGNSHQGASWLDMAGVAPYHHENFENDSLTRWDLFDSLRDTSWAGCVEARPAPHDVSDSPANPDDDESFFVPMFAPDEPDDSWQYYNDYLDDGGGACSGSTRNMSEKELQERTCKYDDERPSGGGPNYMCDSRAITPLTASETAIQDAIDDMLAVGATNIMEGVMWGWRVLSPAPPFSEGRAYDDDENRKVMIVMSDGANTHYGTWNDNDSRYSAFGFAKNNRLRSATNNSALLAEAMNEKTEQACANAKGAGVIIYTVAFDITDSDTLDLLAGCATNAARAFTIGNGDALLSVFEAIADDINKLRISS